MQKSWYLMNLEYYGKWLEEDLMVIRAEGLEDLRAVIGAKTSRSILLEKKWPLETGDVKEFLEKNLLGYGHASIADMSFVSIFSRGFGWLSAWLLEDDPLFNGQEVSTRAVNILKNFPNKCYDCPDHFLPFHTFFSSLFNEISANAQKGGYKYDDTRWALPGSLSTGVTIMMTARTIIRHLEQLDNIQFMKPTVEKYMKGVFECAPVISSTFAGKKRKIKDRWRELNIIQTDRKYITENPVRITPPSDIYEKDAFRNFKQFSSRKAKEYMPDEMNSLGLFEVNIFTSIASARDWHRHRSVMPWTLSLVTANDRAFMFNEVNENVSGVKDMMFEASKLIEQQEMNTIYALPFGTCVHLKCFATLTNLLYMLELRAFSDGVNEEYKHTAICGLKELRKILGSKFSSYFNIVS